MAVSTPSEMVVSTHWQPNYVQNLWRYNRRTLKKSDEMNSKFLGEAFLLGEAKVGRARRSLFEYYE